MKLSGKKNYPEVGNIGEYLGLIFEFLGILGFLPLLGYIADKYLFGDDGRIGWFFIIGCFLGFGYGIYHLQRRARYLLKKSANFRINTDRSRPAEQDVSGRADEIEKDLININKKIEAHRRRKQK